MIHENRHSYAKVFFALWPTDVERNQLATWQDPLKRLCGGRSMRIETLHNTIVFVGHVEQSKLESLQLAAREVYAESFSVCFDEARYWGHNHITYAAPVDVPPQLTQLADALERSLVKHRFKFDQREYKPHVTLLRNARWSDAPLPAMPPVHLQASDFALVQSADQEYHVLEKFLLG